MEIRLNKYLASCGVGSRRKCDTLIMEGYVKINGKIEKNPATRVDPGKDKVQFSGKIMYPERKKVYIILFKPYGVITSVKDEKGRKTVMDLIKEKNRVYPVGRLDRDSAGLILLTNDGELSHRLMHPSHKVKKSYLVLIDRTMTNEDMQHFASGVVIDRKITAPAEIKRDEGNWLLVTIREGRNRQIRKMMEKLGYEVKKLIRIQFAGLNLNGLSPGEYRHLKPGEVTKLKKRIGN